VQGKLHGKANRRTVDRGRESRFGTRKRAEGGIATLSVRALRYEKGKVRARNWEKTLKLSTEQASRAGTMNPNQEKKMGRGRNRNSGVAKASFQSRRRKEETGRHGKDITGRRRMEAKT